MVRMRTATFVLAVALALAAAPATGVHFTAEDMESDDSMWALYERWGAHYEVARDAGDKLRRFGVSKETVRSVYAADPGDRRYEYVLRLNNFADMTDDEFRGSFACRRPARHVDAGGKRHFNITPQAEGELR